MYVRYHYSYLFVYYCESKLKASHKVYEVSPPLHSNYRKRVYTDAAAMRAMPYVRVKMKGPSFNH